MKTLLQNAQLMGINELQNITIEDGVFQSIQSANNRFQQEKNIRTINLEGKVVLPSFADVHMHLDKAFTYPAIQNKSGTLFEAVQSFQNYQVSINSEILETSMSKGIYSAIRHGTTALRTHLDGNSTEYIKHVVEAYHAVKNKFSDHIHIEAVIMCPLNMTMELENDIRWALNNGIEHIGGAPHLSEHPQKNLERIFDIAVSVNTDIDLHVDESDDPQVSTLPDICKLTDEAKYNGRVIAAHCTSLSAMEKGKAYEILQRVKESKVNIVTLPGANLYLQGRNDQGIIRRGLTRVKEMIELGIPVAVGSDNIQDPFHPFGKADLLQMALLGSYGAQLTSEKHMNKLIEMISTIPDGLMKRKNGLSPGCSADFIILETLDPRLILAEQTPTREIWRNGKVICRVTEVVEFETSLHANITSV
ncbi:amidohydrolase family protein [Peribacillus butanolivorans]|uniref:amidohydrolase family protein n=1 Tax=Peribacillus butanolivorans TaxID=421767 RepID=UPI00365E8F09